jgi:DNA-binding CsgD family transcriptional regulator
VSTGSSRTSAPRLFAKKKALGEGPLTPREKQVLRLAVEGNPDKSIAEQLGVNVNTVKHHLKCIFDKTGLSTRKELAFRFSAEIIVETLQQERMEDEARHLAEKQELQKKVSALKDMVELLQCRVNYLLRSKPRTKRESQPMKAARTILVAMLFAAALPIAFAQATTPQAANTYKIADEGDAITSGPSTATLQVGVAGKNWTPTVTVTSYPITVSWANGGGGGAFGPDPDYGVLKKSTRWRPARSRPSP